MQQIFFWLLSLLATVVAGGLYAEDSPVVSITDDMWQSIVDSDELWLLELYAPWCGHCKALQPHYEKAASNLKGLVKVGAVDCEANPKIAQMMGVKQYPLIRFLPAERTFNPYTNQAQKMVTEYQGSHNAREIINAALKLMPYRVTSVNDTAGSDEFFEDDYPKVLLFSQKSEISSLYKSLSWQFRDKMRFGQASDKDEKLIAKFNVKTFPHVVVVPGDDVSKAVAHTGAIKREELNEFIGKYALKERTADPGSADRKKLLVRISSAAEFESKILKDSDKPWLVLFEKGRSSVQSNIASLAGTIAPAVQVAIVDSAEIAKSQDVTTFPTVRLYQADKSDVEDLSQEKPTLEQLKTWLDDKLGGYVSNLQIGDPLNSFLQTKCLEGPCLFYFGTQAEPPMFLRLVSIEYHKSLHFGMVSNPPASALQQIGVTGKLPKVVVFFSQNGTVETLAAMPYTGQIDLEGLLAFAGSLSKKAEPKGSSKGGEKTAAPLQQVNADHPLDKLCAGGGLCAIAFIDGSNDANREDAIRIFDTVRTKKSGSPYRFIWVDAICQNEIAAAFDITPEKLPTLVVVSPGKMRQRQLTGVFDVETLVTFLDGVLSGKLGTSPFSSIPPTFTGDCKTLHDDYQAAMAPADSSSTPEDDPIMAEVLAAARQREEEERKLRPKKKSGDDDDDDDDEPKKKKKKKKKKAKKE